MSGLAVPRRGEEWESLLSARNSKCKGPGVHRGKEVTRVHSSGQHDRGRLEAQREQPDLPRMDSVSGTVGTGN